MMALGTVLLIVFCIFLGVAGVIWGASRGDK